MLLYKRQDFNNIYLEVVLTKYRRKTKKKRKRKQIKVKSDVDLIKQKKIVTLYVHYFLIIRSKKKYKNFLVFFSQLNKCHAFYCNFM